LNYRESDRNQFVLHDWRPSTFGPIVFAMARQEIITDDITGEPNAQQLYIALNSKAWTIDLAEGSRAKLDKALAPFLAKATPVKGSNAPKSAKAKSSSGYDVAELRAWAKKKKIALPSRGRISGAVIERYRAEVAG
jgi:hypothetical protein